MRQERHHIIGAYAGSLFFFVVQASCTFFILDDVPVSVEQSRRGSKAEGGAKQRGERSRGGSEAEGGAKPRGGGLSRGGSGKASPEPGSP